MTGRRMTHWRDGNDIPQGGMVANKSPDYSESFEDELVEKMDHRASMGSIIRSLPPAQQRVFVRDLLGYKCESPGERMNLTRARRKVAKLLENVL